MLRASGASTFGRVLFFRIGELSGELLPQAPVLVSRLFVERDELVVLTQTVRNRRLLASGSSGRSWIQPLTSLNRQTDESCALEVNRSVGRVPPPPLDRSGSARQL